MTGATVPDGYTLEETGWGDEELADLIRRSAAEVLPLYEGDDLSKQRVRPLVEGDVLTVAVVRHRGRIVATGLLSDAHGDVEVNRVAVAAGHRRQGLARAVLAELERRARARGIRRLRLQTGFRQLPAIVLYEREGWRRIPPYGPYVEDDVVSVCFEKELS
ncbi:MAG: GNAT family N-acetyltransferase [Microbacterium sp.]